MQPFVGQLLLASFNFAPRGFAACNGQLIAINQNQALFALLGTFYGGNGTSTFALPNLQGRAPVSAGTDFVLGSIGGADSHTLNINEVPTHTHTINADGAANATRPNGAMLGSGGVAVYQGAANLAAMNPATLLPAGGSQPHENRQPFLVMNWVISLSGIFPSQN